MGTDAISSEVKRPVREADHSPPASAEVRSRKCGSINSHSHMPSWRSAYFTFIGKMLLTLRPRKSAAVHSLLQQIDTVGDFRNQHSVDMLTQNIRFILTRHSSLKVIMYPAKITDTKAQKILMLSTKCLLKLGFAVQLMRRG
jgi:hypothetical protein